MFPKSGWIRLAPILLVTLTANYGASRAQPVLPLGAAIGGIGPKGYHYGGRHHSTRRSHAGRDRDSVDQSECDSACKTVSCDKDTSCKCTRLRDGKLEARCR